MTALRAIADLAALGIIVFAVASKVNPRRPRTYTQLAKLLPEAAVESVHRDGNPYAELVIYTGLACDPSDVDGERLIEWSDR